MSTGRCVVVYASVAALLAGCSSGRLGAPPELADVTYVSGDRDGITFTFELRDQDLTRADVLVEYSVDGGAWRTATISSFSGMPGGVSGGTICNIITSTDWQKGRIVWDSYADGVGLDGAVDVRLRLTSSDIDGGGDTAFLESPTSQITVNNNYASLVVNASPINFGLRLSRLAETPAQEITFTITNGMGAHGTTLYWEVWSDQPWLLVNEAVVTSAAPMSGMTPGAPGPYENQMQLSADVDGNVSGTPLVASPVPYVATLTITGEDTGPGGPPVHGAASVTVTVRVTVKDSEAELFLHDGGGSSAPSLVEFVCIEGDVTATPASQTFSIQNVGEQLSLLNWDAVDNLLPVPDWLPNFEVGLPDSGQLAWDAPAPGATVTVTANPTGMPAGHHPAVITVSGTENFSGDPAIASPDTVNVSLWVKTQSEVGLSLSSWQFPDAIAGIVDPLAPRDIVLTNIGEQDLDWSVDLAGLPSWITDVSLSSGTGLAYQSTATIAITVDPDAAPALVPGDYSYTLWFQSTNSSTPAKPFVANLHVFARPTMSVSPPSMSFTGNTISPPSSQQLSITRVGANVAPLDWSTSISYISGLGWLSTSPTSGTTTGTSSVTVYASPGVMAPGTYQATITITSVVATNSPINVPVTLTVPSGSSIVITECSIGTDFIEIQNVSGMAIDTTGWVVAISDSYSIINTVNAVEWSLPSTMSASQILYRTDGAVNPWGSNIFWDGSGDSWAMIVDDSGEIVDFVAWGWTAAEIAGMSTWVNGFPISIGSEFIGNGVPRPGVGSIQRQGNADNDNAADFAWVSPSSMGVTNTGLVVPFVP